MSRFVSRGVQMVIDVAVLSLAYWLAFVIRFEGEIPVQMLKRGLFLWPYIIAFQFAVLYLRGVSRQVWRYVGLREVSQVLGGVVIASAALIALRMFSAVVLPSFGYAQYLLLPLGVIIIDAGLAFLAVAGVRVLRRLQIERRDVVQRRDSQVELVPTMLIGAGSAGVMVAKEVQAHPDMGLKPVGFLDDDPMKIGTEVHGLRVWGATSELAELCAKHGAKQALITIASAHRKDIRMLVKRCDEAGIAAKIIPGIHEIVSGKVELSRIRRVTIEDLLGREPVELDEKGIAAFIKGRVVMVTGAGGSIGSEICRQVLAYGPDKLILAERSENSLFDIDRDLRRRGGASQVVPCIADITDEARMRDVLGEHRPEVVLHAAAHKHVPMMERNPGEAIKNNVLGTKLMADLSDELGVKTFVMISTDKAVNPTSIMGATKRIAEMYTQALSAKSQTRFVTVRFGNVLGSVGSVVPIFKEQIAKGGPVTVTHPEMQRYFMTIPEACQLVLQAATMGEGGEIFILDMGEPVKIVDLARDLVRLSGLRPDQDIEIQFTGVRPGEKLFEEIATDGEHANKTKHPKIYVGKQEPCEYGVVAAHTQRLRSLSASAPDDIKRAVATVVPEYLGAPSEPAASDPDDPDSQPRLESKNPAKTDAKKNGALVEAR